MTYTYHVLRIQNKSQALLDTIREKEKTRESYTMSMKQYSLHLEDHSTSLSFFVRAVSIRDQASVLQQTQVCD